jgi:hypothetical protein
MFEERGAYQVRLAVLKRAREIDAPNFGADGAVERRDRDAIRGLRVDSSQC